MVLSEDCAKMDTRITEEDTANTAYKHTLRIFFRIISDFVHRFILDRTFVDFTGSLLSLPF
jgi:hypothetical protein